MIAASTVHSRRRARPCGRSQRGVVAVISVIWVMVALIGLMALDIGNVFWQRRDMQRLADTAALSAGQMIGGGCATAQAHGIGSVRDAGAGTVNLKPADTLVIDCGHWDPTKPALPGPTPYFTASVTPYNAVNVNVSRTVPFLFAFNWNSPSRIVSAHATAASPDMNAFSIGTGLLNVSDASPVNQLLNGLLGTSLALDVASYQGLAGADIKLADLLTASPLQFGTMDALLDSKVKLKDFVLTAATALSTTDTVKANVLYGIAANIKSLDVSLGDLIDLSTATPGAASQASVNVMDLLVGAAQVANKSSFVDLGTSINTPLASVGVKVAIIEPPRIAIGPVGTSAHSAQMRVLLDIKALNVNLGLASLAVLNLPIYIEGASGTAKLKSMSCAPARADASLTMDVETGLLSTCISGAAASSMPTGSNSSFCSTPATVTALTVPVILLGDVGVTINATVPVKASSSVRHDVVFGAGGAPGSTVSNSYQVVNQNVVGTALSGLVGTLITESTLTPVVKLGPIVITTPPAVSSLLTNVKSALTSTLAAITPQLDALIAPLLRTLGVDIGYSQIHQMSMRCGDVQLVY